MKMRNVVAALLMLAAAVPPGAGAQENERERDRIRDRERDRVRERNRNADRQDEEDDREPATPSERRQSGQIDTTVTVGADVRVIVQNFGGSIIVKSWDRNAVRLVARYSRRDYVALRASATTVRVQSGSSRGPSLSADYELTVPATADLSLGGTYTDVDVDGVRGSIRVETVQGNVSVRGGSGVVALKSVQGQVMLQDARAGRIELNAVNEGIRVRNVTGDRLAVETVNGGIVMDGVDSPDVEAVTVNGNIAYQGTLRDRGQYLFATHNGRLDVAVPENANATVSVATYSGQFSSAFPVNRGSDSSETGARARRSSRRFSFTIGSGSARLDLESFQGGIRLRRPGAAAPREREKERDDR